MRLTTLGLVRTAYVVVAALVSATLLPRLGVPAAWVPDLVLIGVVSTAVLRGPTHGALIGLAAGWVVELVPPVGRPLGLTALTMMVAGLVAGLLHRSASRSFARPFGALLAAVAVVVTGHAFAALGGGGRFDPGTAVATAVATALVAAGLLPFLVAVDRALVRRRLG